MKMPVSKDAITSPSFTKPNKAKKKGQSVSLPIEQIDTLNHWVDELTFSHRIKDASVSEVVEMALAQFFKQNSIDDMAKLAKKKRL
ncbi:hypothetical protein [Vibrio sp. 99-8-1]|uniref:hypothetical protein n=1 Tax=Vibrio sp. 99-8-1 TaxID=2607602 RepID=UPI0014933F49|nr:hypothetical protein [Vibrio sp. 99-8-1]NOI66890.1 hypothetical protein [Vibrio sp. 99-8-1]